MTDRRRRSLWSAIIATVVLLLAGGGYCYYAWEQSKWTTAPAAPQSQAADTCREFTQAGLACTVTTAYSTGKAPKQLIKQEPAPRTRLRKGSPIVLTYSLGPKTTKLPELRNSTVDDATEQLKPFAITVKTTKLVNDSGVAKGRITATDPTTGTLVKNGSTVNVSVSSGLLTVPNWVGQPKEVVASDATRFGITVAYKEQESDGPAGLVLKQSATGLTVMTDTVQIILSKAKTAALVAVPQVVKQEPTQAQITVATAGFNKIVVVTKVNPKAKKATVVAVSPTAGTKVKTDTTITLTVEQPKA